MWERTCLSGRRFGEVAAMGATSWSTAVTVIIALLQVQGLMSVTTTTVTGVEGQTLSFRCDYPQGCQSSVKYFYQADSRVSETHLLVTDKSKQWARNGRFSLYDNTTEACVVIGVDELAPEDSGMYWCGVDISSGPDHITVIELTVVQATTNPQDNLLHYITVQAIYTLDPPVGQVTKPLFLMAVMCVAAMLSVCAFTLCLLLTVKHRRSRPSHSRQMSAEYETMMPGVRNEPKCSCACPDCISISAFSPPPPNRGSSFTSKQRESTVSLGIGELMGVDAPGHICQCRHLNVSKTEDNVYHNLHGNRVPKDERPTGVEEQANC